MPRYFYPRPPRGGRRAHCSINDAAPKFLSTPSARRATQEGAGPAGTGTISIHALREEGDTRAVMSVVFLFYFYPRPPRGGRRPGRSCCASRWPISIHALREEGDHLGFTLFALALISIHALREEGDASIQIWDCQQGVFLSTPSARRATVIRRFSSARSNNFYPRPPRGGRRAQRASGWSASKFLSTPSARRATGCWAQRLHGITNFYPRPPRGGRRLSCRQGRPQVRISIHALREEGDPRQWRSTGPQAHFYPRPPRGGRHLSCRQGRPQVRISIHALREEGDSSARTQQTGGR